MFRKVFQEFVLFNMRYEKNKWELARQREELPTPQIQEY